MKKSPIFTTSPEGPLINNQAVSIRLTNKVLAAWVLGCASLLLFWIYWQFPDLISNFSTAIPAGFNASSGHLFANFFGGDHIQVFYYGWKLKDNLTNGVSPFIDPYTFAARGQINVDLLMGVQYQAMAFWGWVLGDVPGYNFANFIFAPIVTFVGGFFLLRVITTNLFVCSVGAFIITLIPYRWIQMAGGHSGGFVHMFLPFYFWGILRHRVNKDDKWGDSLAGLILFATVISDEHQGYYLILASMFIFIVWFLQALFFQQNLSSLQKITRFLRRWLGLMAGLAITVGYGFVLDKLVLSSAEGGTKFERSFGEIKRYSHDLPHFFSNSGVNCGALLIWLVPGVFILSFFVLRIRDKNFASMTALKSSPFLAFIITLPICALIMAGLGGHWSQQSGVYEFFYSALPYFKYQRVPGKIFGVVTILLVILATSLYASLRAQPKGKFLSALLTLGLVAQLLQYTQFFATQASGVAMSSMQWEPKSIIDYMRQHTSKEDIFLLVPASEGTGGRFTTLNYYFAYKTNRRFSSGYSGNPPSYFLQSRKYLTLFNDGFPDRKALEVARADGITYMLLAYKFAKEDGIDNLEQEYAKKEYLQPVVCDDTEGFCLYKFKYEPKVIAAQANPGWTATESYRRFSGRWMRSGGDSPKWMSEQLAKDFRVISHMHLDNRPNGKAAQVELVFWSWKEDFSLWILEEGQEPRPLHPPWPRQEDGYHVKFAVQSADFYLASKQSWNLRDRGHFDDIEFGHFVTKVIVW